MSVRVVVVVSSLRVRNSSVETSTYVVCRPCIRRIPHPHAKVSVGSKYLTRMPDVHLSEIESVCVLDEVSVLETRILYRVHRPHAPKPRGIRRRYGFDGVYFPYVLRTSPAVVSRRADNHCIVVFGLDFHELSGLTFADRVLSLIVYVL